MREYRQVLKIFHLGLIFAFSGSIALAWIYLTNQSATLGEAGSLDGNVILIYSQARTHYIRISWALHSAYFFWALLWTWLMVSIGYVTKALLSYVFHRVFHEYRDPKEMVLRDQMASVIEEKVMFWVIASLIIYIFSLGYLLICREIVPNSDDVFRIIAYLLYPLIILYYGIFWIRILVPRKVGKIRAIAKSYYDSKGSIVQRFLEVLHLLITLLLIGHVWFPLLATGINVLGNFGYSLLVYKSDYVILVESLAQAGHYYPNSGAPINGLPLPGALIETFILTGIFNIQFINSNIADFLRNVFPILALAAFFELVFPTILFGLINSEFSNLKIGFVLTLKSVLLASVLEYIISYGFHLGPSFSSLSILTFLISLTYFSYHLRSS